MPLVPLKFKPGIVKDITEYASGQAGFYVDGNLVRFRNGFPEKIGGWLQENYTFVADPNTNALIVGKPKHLLAWRSSSDSIDRMGVGTHNHLYNLANGTFHDITPLRKTTSNMSNPLSITNASAVVTVTDNAHGAETGDFIVIKDSTTIGNITNTVLDRLEGYQITKVDSNTYTFVSPTTANTTTTGGGTTIDIQYLIGASNGMGQESTIPALGFGVDGWSDDTWGTPRDISSAQGNLLATNWSLVNWGEDMIANNRGGRLYYWDTSAANESARAVDVSTLAGATGVPTEVNTVAVTFPDRHLIVGGCTPIGGGTIDPMLIRFSDQEDFAVFTPTSTNTSGDQRLEIGTRIVCMTPTRDEMFIQTDEAAYGMSFVGPPFTFSFRLLAVNCGAEALHGTINVDGNVFWMGKSNFFAYDGTVKELPCSVQYFVFDRLARQYVDKTYVGHNKKFNEITWFYVSTNNGNTNPEPDSYVTYNYQDGAWSIGELQRNIWHDATGFRQVPFAFDKDGKLYKHETGTSDNGTAMNCHIETGDIELSTAGDELFLVDKIVPDATMGSNTNLFLELKTRKYPNAPEINKGTFTVLTETEKISVRAKGRQMSVKYSSNGVNDSWLLGDFRINARKDGMR